MQLVIVINLLDNCLKKVVEAYLCEVMYEGKKEKKMGGQRKGGFRGEQKEKQTKDKDKTLGRKNWLCAWVGRKRKKMMEANQGWGGGGGWGRSKVFCFLAKF